jgi:hypothetical protein
VCVTSVSGQRSPIHTMCHSRMPFKPAPLSHQTAWGGDAREAVEALIVANHYLETDLEKLRAAVSKGYAPWPIAAA